MKEHKTMTDDQRKQYAFDKWNFREIERIDKMMSFGGTMGV